MEDFREVRLPPSTLISTARSLSEKVLSTLYAFKTKTAAPFEATHGETT